MKRLSVSARKYGISQTYTEASPSADPAYMKPAAAQHGSAHCKPMQHTELQTERHVQPPELYGCIDPQSKPGRPEPYDWDFMDAPPTAPLAPPGLPAANHVDSLRSVLDSTTSAYVPSLASALARTPVAAPPAAPATLASEAGCSNRSLASGSATAGPALASQREKRLSARRAGTAPKRRSMVSVIGSQEDLLGPSDMQTNTAEDEELEALKVSPWCRAASIHATNIPQAGASASTLPAAETQLLGAQKSQQYQCQHWQGQQLEGQGHQQWHEQPQQEQEQQQWQNQPQQPPQRWQNQPQQPQQQGTSHKEQDDCCPRQEFAFCMAAARGSAGCSTPPGIRPQPKQAVYQPGRQHQEQGGQQSLRNITNSASTSMPAAAQQQQSHQPAQLQPMQQPLQGSTQQLRPQQPHLASVARNGFKPPLRVQPQQHPQQQQQQQQQQQLPHNHVQQEQGLPAWLVQQQQRRAAADCVQRKGAADWDEEIEDCSDPEYNPSAYQRQCQQHWQLQQQQHQLPQQQQQQQVRRVPPNSNGHWQQGEAAGPQCEPQQPADELTAPWQGNYSAAFGQHSNSADWQRADEEAHQCMDCDDDDEFQAAAMPRRSAQHPQAPAAAAAVHGAGRGAQPSATAVAASGGPGGAPGGQVPWWARLPDFVPVEALAGGKDPRTGMTVYVDYKSQFQNAATPQAHMPRSRPREKASGTSSRKRRSDGEGKRGKARGGSKAGAKASSWVTINGKPTFVAGRGGYKKRRPGGGGRGRRGEQ